MCDMACTSQSAVDFITKARIHLVKNLKYQALIAEKLEACGVFNSDDVAAVTSENNPLIQTRNILDVVTKKGEEASYVFLRILDSERNRTLPKDVRPDLHQWISCFSFREEPEFQPTGPRSCQQYQKQLKTKAREILNTHMEQICFLLGSNDVKPFFYTPLVLDRQRHIYAVSTKIKQKTKKYKKTRTKKLRAYIPKSKPQLSPEDLLKCNEQHILLVGKPGIGKTTVALEMLNLWANKETQKLSYLFYFNETTLSGMPRPMDLESLLFDAYVKPAVNRAEVYQDIKANSECVIVIVDGIKDELMNSFLKLIYRELSEAKVIVTCRLDCDLLSIQKSYRVCVEGFNEDSIKTYLSYMLKDKPDALSFILENPELHSLCHVPVHALMVAACMLFPRAITPKLCTATEIYLNIFRHLMNKCDQNIPLRKLNTFIQDNKRNILYLCEGAVNAIRKRSVLLQDCEDIHNDYSFLNQIILRDGPTSVKTYGTFLHNTMLEFFAALWLLANPGDIDGFLCECKTDEGKHMRHVIPFLSGLLSEKNLSLVSCLCAEDYIRVTSTRFFEQVLNTFIHTQADCLEVEDTIDNTEELLFLCQCLFEFQSPQGCSDFLSRVNHHLDLADGCLDPHQYCTLSYIIKQASTVVVLDLENCQISIQGLKIILDCCEHVSVNSRFLRQIWTAALSCENPGVYSDLLILSRAVMHLPIWDPSVFERAAEVLRQNPQKISLVLHCDQSPHSLSEDLCSVILSVLPFITSLSLTPQDGVNCCEEWEKTLRLLQLEFCLHTFLLKRDTANVDIMALLRLFKISDESDFLSDLYCHVRHCESQTGKILLPSLKMLYMSVPAVWSIDLSKKKASLFLEVLKIQPWNKPVELTGWTDEECEVRSFLQCLPYISQLRFPQVLNKEPVFWMKKVRSFHMNLCVQAALWQEQFTFPVIQTLLNLLDIADESNFMFDLFAHVKEIEFETQRKVLKELRSVYQSIPESWSIDLSERKASLFLEILKFQIEKKPVELTGWLDEESEVRSFLHCLPHMTQLSCNPPRNEMQSYEEWIQKLKTFHMNLCLQGLLLDKECGHARVQTLLKLCSLHNNSAFLLDLYSYVNDYGNQTGTSLLSALQKVFLSFPAVWSFDLSEGKTSVFLEVLKLQRQKKPVELRGWSDEESEERMFLQCLPYISQLKLNLQRSFGETEEKNETFCLDLCLKAALYCRDHGFSSVLTLLNVLHTLDNSEFLLDLYSHLMEFESKTGIQLLPAFQPVYKSGPPIWSLDLSKSKASLLLDVLKLQTQKKPVELRGWSNEKTEMRSFLQCLPYISQLRLTPPQLEGVSSEERVKLFPLELCRLAALCERESVLPTVRTLLTLFSVDNESDFLLDLYYYVRACWSHIESLLPALQPVYQSLPAIWSIDLSKRKASLLLEVLKLQTQKRPVELMRLSDEESEVRSFLQCLPYISQLRFFEYSGDDPEEVFQFLVNLSVAAVVSDSATGERFSELLCSVCSFPFEKMDEWSYECHGHDCHIHFLLVLCSRVKDTEINTDKSLLPALKPFYQSAPEVWSINLLETKASLLLEVLKLQTQKRPVELMRLSDEESEVRSFLQCLPYISQLSFCEEDVNYDPEEVFQFLVNLSVAAVVSDSATGERFSELLCSVCSFPFEKMDEWSYECHGHDCHIHFLLVLCSRVKDTEINTDKSLLPALKPFYQSAPEVWSINLLETKASLLLEVLKLQTQKRPVELMRLSDEESEVRSFLQCLPYISQLSFCEEDVNYDPEEVFQFLVNLSVAAVVSDSATGERFSELLCSVCSFPFEKMDECSYECHGPDCHIHFLLVLCSRVKDTEINTDKSLLPALKPFYQSAPEVWPINLLETKASLLLEVLKLQTQKRPVELMGLSDEESEVRSFLQCLPYISQLSFCEVDVNYYREEVFQFLVNLSVAAVVSDSATGERFSELLCSVCSFPFEKMDEWSYECHGHDCHIHFLLVLYSRVKDTEINTDKSLLPALKPFYQSAPKVWSVNLLETKASLLLEVLKLQTQKRPVELMRLSDEESEVRSFLQCLPYISQLSFCEEDVNYDPEEAFQFLVNLSVAAVVSDSATGERFSELLCSVCSFPFEKMDECSYECHGHDCHIHFLLVLCSRVKDTEINTDKSLLPALKPFYQSAPEVWPINLLETKASLLLEVLKLQTQRRPVELMGLSDEESEVRSFLQCLPYISQLSFFEDSVNDPEGVFQFLVNLSAAAAECDAATGERFSELLSSVCSYSTFPVGEFNPSFGEIQQNYFLLDLYSHIKACKTETHRSVSLLLQSVLQSAPAVWSIDLPDRKASLLLEVLKLHTQKKPVEIRGWLAEESEVRSFLQCLPYITQLTFHHGYKQNGFLLDCRNVGSAEELTHLVQLLDNIKLDQEMSDTECMSVGKVLSRAPKLDLTLTLQHISLRGVRLLFRGVTHLHKLRLNVTVVMRLARAMRTGRGLAPVTVQELSLDLNSAQVSQRVLSRVLSCLALLLRVWTVQCLDLTSCRVESHFLIILLSHQHPLKLRLNKTHVRQLFRLTSQAQDVELTQSFLEKVGGNLTSCTLTQEVLQSLHQHHLAPVTVDFKKCKFTERNAGKLLPLLDRIQFKRLPRDLVWSVIMEIYQTRSPQYVSSLLSSTEKYINLTTRGLDAADCAALRFTLQHSQGVRLNLMWTSIPEGELESLLQLLTNVSQLSVDRQLLLKFLHCCDSGSCSPDVQQGAAASLLLSLQHRLDLSCCSAVDLTEETQEPPLHLRPEDCRVIAMVIKRVRANPELSLMDCDVEEAGLEDLFSVLDIIRLRCSKAQLLQLLRLVSVGSKGECVRRAVSLSHAVGGEVDLSHTVLDLKACGSLALFLEYSEGLSELDLSYCQLTDQCLEPLLPHLHKIQVLDLSYNSITDDGAQLIHSTVIATASNQTVRLFNNNIRTVGPYRGDRRFEIW